MIATLHDKILQASYREMNWELLRKHLNRIVIAVENNDEVTLHAILAEVVPEFQTKNNYSVKPRVLLKNATE